PSELLQRDEFNDVIPQAEGDIPERSKKREKKKKKSGKKKKPEEAKTPVDTSVPHNVGEPQQQLPDDVQPSKPVTEEQVVTNA
ncbi:hypothetical protein A2U01_0089913, partial [Trifolium medium]|nr:hypothetical protein [Trifolium medium]